jgi:DNA-binding NarL/FixJ family response regulator
MRKRGDVMKSKLVKKPPIHIAVIESDPLRLVGLRAVLGPETEFETVPASLEEVRTASADGVCLLGGQPENALLGMLDRIRAVRPDLKVLLTVAAMSDDMALRAVSSGARGCLDEAASPAEFVHALRVVNEGGTWAPRRVLAAFIERSSESFGRVLRRGQFTARENQVLQMLVEGRSNKEIAAPLGIEERTVKSHVAKLMRKMGVQNRISLSVQAIKNSLVSPGAN